MVYLANSTLEIVSAISKSKIKTDGWSARLALTLIVWLLKEFMDNPWTSVRRNSPSKSPLSEEWRQWCVFYCHHLEDSPIDFTKNNGIRFASLCLHVRLYSPLKWTGSFQPQQTSKHVIVRCCKIIQHTLISLRSTDSCKWEGSDGVMCFHGCSSGQLYFVWEEETNCISYVEGKSFLNLESFITWIISFEHVFLQLPHCRQGLRKSRVLQCSQR